MTKFNLIAVEKGLKGITFPATKDEIIEKAKENRVDDSVMDMLHKLKASRYAQLSDINEELGKSDD